MIGDNIQVKVTGVKGHQVTLGILAPREVSIDREEVRVRKRTTPQGTTPTPQGRAA